MHPSKSLTSKIAYGVMASWFNRAVAIGLNLILIPVLFHHMGKEELGLWFLLGQSGAFLALMDFGLAPTIIRRVAFLKARHEGNISQEGGSKETLSELAATANAIYRYLSVGVFVLAWSTGILFLNQLNLEGEMREKVFWAWTIMSFGYALNIWSGFWSSLLQGMGYVATSLVINMVINIAMIVTQILIVLNGGGLLELAIVSVISALSIRAVTTYYIYRKEPQATQFGRQWDYGMARGLFRSAFRAWVTVLGAFLVLKTDQYFIAAFKGAGQIPAYHAAYQLTSNLYMLAVALAGSSSVFISALWEMGQFDRVRQIVIRNLQSGLAILICGSVCLVIAGEDIINLWLGAGNFIGLPVLVLFCITLTLQTQHEMCMTMSRATENEVYAYVSLIAGGLNLVCTFVLIQWYGLIGVVLGTFFAQLMTNNWFGVYRGLNRLKIAPATYIREILIPICLLVLVAIFVGFIVRSVVIEIDLSWLRVLFSILATGSLLALAITIFTFTNITRVLPVFSANKEAVG